MKTPLSRYQLGPAAAILFFCGAALSQGCDQGILDYQVSCDTAPNGWVNASRCSGFGSGADPCYYCYQGSGVCVKKDRTQVQYYLANEGYDDTCPSCAGCCNGSVNCGQIGYGLVCDRNTCNCTSSSPIIIDVSGRGFHLTSAEQGVSFDILGDGVPIRISWTAAGSSNAFLALDRNHNGTIDSGKELFGNVTEQSQSADPNGFLALAEFDKPENGGNGDGIIDNRDAVFSSLLLWVDENHDGVSQRSELHTLPELGVFSLALRYRDDEHFFDQYGNWFHYQAGVNPDPKDGKSRDGRIAYDVFFLPARDRPDISGGQSFNRRLQLSTWELSLGDELAPLSRIGKKGCRPKLQQQNSGGSR